MQTNGPSSSSHQELLDQKFPHEWMQNHPDQAARLNVHGHDQFKKIVQERYEKFQKELRDAKYEEEPLSVIDENDVEDEETNIIET